LHAAGPFGVRRQAPSGAPDAAVDLVTADAKSYPPLTWRAKDLSPSGLATGRTTSPRSAPRFMATVVERRPPLPLPGTHTTVRADPLFFAALPKWRLAGELRGTFSADFP